MREVMIETFCFRLGVLEDARVTVDARTVLLEVLESDVEDVAMTRVAVLGA